MSPAASPPPAGARPDHPSYAGSFFVFGHGTCEGEACHCEVHTYA